MWRCLSFYVTLFLFPLFKKREKKLGHVSSFLLNVSAAHTDFSFLSAIYLLVGQLMFFIRSVFVICTLELSYLNMWLPLLLVGRILKIQCLSYAVFKVFSSRFLYFAPRLGTTSHTVHTNNTNELFLQRTVHSLIDEILNIYQWILLI